MPRSTKRTAATVATSLLVACGAAFAAHSATGSTAASTAAPAAPAAQVRTVAQTAPADTPSGFVDLPTRPLADDGRTQEISVHYRNTGDATRSVAPQILVVSADSGPYLEPGDLRLEQLDPATGQWTRVPLGTQTGTLYTAIPAAGRQLPAGGDLVADYRLTVEPSGAAAARHAVVQPRIVLFDPAPASGS